MNRNSTTENRTSTAVHRLVMTSFGLAAIATVAYVPVAVATSNPTGQSTCNWTVDQLPRTPDAVEGWYRQCKAVHLGTPDATEGWLS